MTNPTEHLEKKVIREYVNLRNKRSTLLTDEQEIFLNEVRDHLAQCPKCSANVHVLESFYFGEIKKYQGRRKIRRNILATASVAILLFTTVYIAPWQNGNEKSNIVSENNKDSTKSIVSKDSTSQNLIENDKEKSFTKNEKEIDNNLALSSNDDIILGLIASYLAKKENNNNLTLLTYSEQNNFNLPTNFREDIIQESQINDFTRFSPQEVEIISPKNSEVLSPPITFKWKNLNTEVAIIIKDNKNKKVWEGLTQDQSSLVCKANLEPGVYYWDFRINNKIKRKRKFFLVDPELEEN